MAARRWALLLFVVLVGHEATRGDDEFLADTTRAHAGGGSSTAFGSAARDADRCPHMSCHMGRPRCCTEAGLRLPPKEPLCFPEPFSLRGRQRALERQGPVDPMDVWGFRRLPADAPRHRIWDGFTFNNELDMLELRLHELYPVVHRFVLVESPLSFTNKPKPLHFAENKQRFAKYLDKIVHVVVDDKEMDREDDDPSQFHNPNSHAWRRQYYQRDAISRGFEEAGALDLCVISDLDEIVKRETVEAVAGCNWFDNEEFNGLDIWPIALYPRIYYYSFRFQFWHRNSDGTPSHPGLWPWGAFILPRARLDVTERSTGNEPVDATPSNLRRRSWFHPWEIVHIEDAGWHLSYFGDEKMIQAKLGMLSDQARNTPEARDLDAIRRKRLRGEDMHQRTPVQQQEHGTLGPAGHVWRQDGTCCDGPALPTWVYEEPNWFVARDWLADKDEVPPPA